MVYRGLIDFFLDEHVLLYSLTLFTFTVIGIFIYIKNQVAFFDERRIPRGPLPSIPFGNIQDVLNHETPLFYHLWKYYNKFKRKQFKYGGLCLFLKPGILFVDPKLTELILNEEKLRDVITLKVSEKIVRVFRQSIVEGFLMYHHEIEQKLLESLEPGEVDVSKNLRDFFIEATIRITGFEYDDETRKLLQMSLEENNCLSFKQYLCVCHPIFSKFLNFKSCSTHRKLLHKYVRQCMNNRKKNDIRKLDLIQALSDNLNIDEESRTSDGIIDEFLQVVLDNLQNALAISLFGLFEVCSNSEIQEDLTGEIRRFKKDNKAINSTNLNNMVYLDTVVKETLRMFPPCPTIFKVCQEKYPIPQGPQENLELPKGTFTIVSVYGIHYNDSNFTSPEIFDPDRFAEQNKKYIKPQTFLPFGGDSNNIIGMEFTAVFVKLAIIGMLSNYKISIPKKYSSFREYDKKKLSPYPQKSVILKLEPIKKAT